MTAEAVSNELSSGPEGAVVHRACARLGGGLGAIFDVLSESPGAPAKRARAPAGHGPNFQRQIAGACRRALSDTVFDHSTYGARPLPVGAPLAIQSPVSSQPGPVAEAPPTLAHVGGGRPDCGFETKSTQPQWPRARRGPHSVSRWHIEATHTGKLKIQSSLIVQHRSPRRRTAPFSPARQLRFAPSMQRQVTEVR